MNRPNSKRAVGRCSLVLLLAAVWIVPGKAAIAAGSGQRKVSLPQFAAVEQAVREVFASQPDFRQGDIISQSQVKGIFEPLGKMGWTVEDQEQILDRVLPDQTYLVRQLRTPSGRKFMPQVSQHPGSYERLDQLAAMPQGKDTIRRLIKGPDGYKMLEYMATSDGGKELGKMLSRTPRGRDFDQSTPRIYTLQQLVDQLKQSYAEAQKTMPN